MNAPTSRQYRRWPTAALLLGLAMHAQAAPEQAALWRQQAKTHEHGEGVPRDVGKALDLYCRAALAGDTEAHYRMGWIYTNGHGVERQDAYAAWYFRLAAEQGDEPSRNMLQLISAAALKPPCIVQAEAEAERRRAEAEAEAAQRRADAWVGTGVALAADHALAAAQASADSVAAIRYRQLADTGEQKRILAMVHRLAPKFGVHPGLAYAVIRAESNFDSQAVSPKNAQGLMQLIPETAARFNVTQPLDPEQNIRGGLAYLRWLLAYFKGNVPLVVAAYNAGEGTVDRFKGVPPYPETQGYVKRIQEVFNLQLHPFDARVTTPSPMLSLPALRPRS